MHIGSAATPMGVLLGLLPLATPLARRCAIRQGKAMSVIEMSPVQLPCAACLHFRFLQQPRRAVSIGRPLALPPHRRHGIHRRLAPDQSAATDWEGGARHLAVEGSAVASLH